MCHREDYRGKLAAAWLACKPRTASNPAVTQTLPGTHPPFHLLLSLRPHSPCQSLTLSEKHRFIQRSTHRYKPVSSRSHTHINPSIISISSHQPFSLVRRLTLHTIPSPPYPLEILPSRAPGCQKPQAVPNSIISVMFFFLYSTQYL